MNVTEVRQLFPGLARVTYLNTATLAVGCTPARRAYESAVERWTEARFDWTEAERAGEVARASFARILGADADEIALVPAVSTAAGIVAANLPPAHRGENVVVAGGEFSSNFFPWLLLRERGYDVRLVPTGAQFTPTDAYAALADSGTRLIAVSAVHSPTGDRADLGALSRIAQRSGAWFFVDACQAAGAIELDVRRDRVDFLAAASHKFLLGSRGMGYLFVRRELLERLHPVTPGWKAGRKPFESFYGPAMELSPTASKLDSSLAWFAALAEVASLGVIEELGLAAIVERNAQLSRHMHDALIQRVPSFVPLPVERRTTIVSVPVADSEAVMARLRAANVVASVRAGRIRLSPHFYNLESELDHAVDVIAGG